MAAAGDRLWKVGELAKRTGVTVRALHHYDKLGLLVPRERTEAGHRHYAEDDVLRLYRILALRQLGLSLDEIGSLLQSRDVGLIATVRRHLERVERELEHGERLRRRLAHILDALERSIEPSVDDFIKAMEVMSMIETTVEDVVVRVDEEEPKAGLPFRPGRPRIVLLRETDGARVLPIWTGFPEADALATQLVGWKLPRPLTFDLTAGLLEAAGARVERVVIESYSENTYFATVTLIAGDESHEVDARPSDALNLAARMGAPVFVDQSVMDDHGVASLQEMESRMIASAEAQLLEAGDETASLPDEPPGGPGEWRSLLERMRPPPSSESPQAD